MKRRLLFSILLSLGVSGAWAQSPEGLSNLAAIEVGDNYFGQSLELSYSTKIISHFWASFSIETGSFFFQDKAGSTFFVFTNNSTINYNVGLNIQDLERLSLSYYRNEKGAFRLLNSLGVGISYFDLTINLSEQTMNSATPYQGQKAISAFALYADLHLLDYYPPGDQLVFSLGIKSSTAFLSSPQTVSTTNSAGSKLVVSYASANGGAIIFPYPELFLSLGRLF